jgi:DNA-binding NtrC family response regulator
LSEQVVLITALSNELDWLRHVLRAQGLAQSVQLQGWKNGVAQTEPSWFVTARPDSPEVAQLVQFCQRKNWWPYLWVVTVAHNAKQGKVPGHLADWPERNLDWIDVADADSVASELAARIHWQSELEDILAQSWLQDRAVGHSAVWRAVLAQIARAARHGQGPCLILGESGCGKEVLARAFHDLSAQRANGPFVVVDCTTLSPELSGSELFGHAKGAFTNAVSARKGAVAYADGGTLFLDEIGELSLSIQAKLLRLIQERAYKPVGEDSWRSSDFRLVCATNRDLAGEVAAGRFRNDLYHRIGQWRVRAPSLRERSDDIPELVRHFLAQASRAEVQVMPNVMEALQRAHYPGNVRDLRNRVLCIADSLGGARVVSSAALNLDAWEVEFSDDAILPHQAKARSHVEPMDWRQNLVAGVQGALLHGYKLQDISALAEDEAITSALSQCRTQKEAAALLGVTTRTLQSRRAADRL